MSRTGSVFVTVLRSRDLRRVELAYATFTAAEYAVWIAMLVYAFDRGGTTTAALVAVVQLIPSAIFAPVAGALADRYRPARVLTWGYVAQAVGMAATAAVMFADGPPLLVYALSAVAATAVTVTRPTQAVLLPALARRPDELTAMNVVTGWVESGTALAGPVIAGGLLAVSAPEIVFAVFAGAVGVGAILVSRIEAGACAEAGGVRAGAVSELAAGFAALARNEHPRLLVIVLSLGYVVWGALDVLTVVLAIDLLGLGDGGPGYLVAAFAAGGVLGGAGAVALVGRRRLVPPILLACLILGGSFALLGLVPTVAGAFLLLAVGGIGQSLLDVAGRTLLQRISPPDVLARIFGLHEGLSMCALAVGSILVPALIALGGPALAFAVTGGVLPIFVLVFLRRLLAIDAAATVPIVEISLLRSMRIFGSLPAPAVEGLAHSLEPVDVPATTVVIRQGDRGDRFYAIADGEVEVVCDGIQVATLGRSEGFGEIALLRDVPRTATVTALRDTSLYALEKEPFVIALTGHQPAGETAESIVRERSGEREAGVAADGTGP